MNTAIKILRAGGVIAHATDTCYGFACDIFSKKALKRLYKMKRMLNTKPISIMVSSITMAKKYGVFTKKAEKFAKKYWPGALTIVVRRKKTLPPFLNPELKSVGIRFPKHTLSLAIVKKFGNPLTTTSANISGKPPPYSLLEIQKQFSTSRYKADLLVDSGKLPPNPASTVVDVTGNEIKILRRGSVRFTRLKPRRSPAL